MIRYCLISHSGPRIHSGGRYEEVEIFLSLVANKAHCNVSDYTPLTLAASGGYNNVIKLLLDYWAEITPAPAPS
jgi:hypothetical protein